MASALCRKHVAGMHSSQAQQAAQAVAPASRVAMRVGRVACHGHAHSEQQRGKDWAQGLVALGAAAAILTSSPLPASARAGTLGPIDATDAERCTVAAFDKFAGTRAAFSMESSGGNMTEAIVDVRECDYHGQDLSGKVLSGVFMQRGNFSGAQFRNSEFARANARGANLSNADFTDTNLYGTQFEGADLQGAQFENSILTGSTFGKDETGTWANLKGAHFEGALVSSSDVARICENPTLDTSTRKFELGCRGSR